MASLPNNTFASPGNSFYALATESAKNWYQFPSLNGQVLLNDASGTQVLQAIGGDLFFNTELLAKASDISDIADWSYYPVLNPAGVNFNGNPLFDASSIQTTGDVSSATVHTGIVSCASLASTGDLSGQTVHSGPITATSISATTVTGTTIQGTSLVTTGGLDMVNTGVTRASAVGISAFGAGPYGSLSSPDGVMLTWNGSQIQTGAGGAVSQWATFPAVANINGGTNNITNVGTISTSGTITSGLDVVATGNVVANTNPSSALVSQNLISYATQPLTVSSGGNLNLYSPAGILTTTVGNISGPGTITTTAAGSITETTPSSINENAGTAFNVTVDQGLAIASAAVVDIKAKNGIGGLINIEADAGYGIGNQQVGYGAVQLNAYGSSNAAFSLGGKIDITAFSAGPGEYGGATSRVSLSAATLALSAGAAPPLPGIAGSMNIFGQGIVSIVASLIPPVLPQFLETVYLFGLGIPGVAGGVRMESPNGIQALSDFYAGTVYPLDGGGLNLKGRSGPTGYVNIEDVATLTMNPATAIQTDRVTSVSNLGVLFQDAIQATTIQPPAATAPGTPNLIIRGNTSFPIPGINNNYVQIQNADTIAFDGSGAGAITGLQTINGFPYVASDTAAWATYKASQQVDISGFGIKNIGDLSGVVNINGQPLSAFSPAGWWAFPAAGTVDMSSNGLTNVSSIGVLNNFNMTSAGSIGIFSDTSSGNINIASNAGGSVIIGTGDAGDITIQTTGAGNDLNLAGDTVQIIAAGADIGLTSTTQILIDAPIVDVTGATVTNVAILSGAAASSLSVTSLADVSIQGATSAVLEALAGTVTVAATGDINLESTTGSVVVQSSVLDMDTHKITNLLAGVAATDGVNVSQLTTATQFRDATEFYVSGNGSDISGNGSILAPYLTIQKAITQAELISSAALVCVINVASGHYTESLTFNKGYVILNGSLQSQTGNEVCEITGSINIAVAGASDLFNRQVTFQGFNFTCGVGQAITDTSTTPHTVSFQDCKAFVNSQFFVSTSAAADMRFYLTNVEVSQFNAAATLPVIVTNVGLAEFERLDVSVDGNLSAIVIGGTSVLSRCSLTTLDITNTATTLLPLLSITSTTTATHSLGNVAFAFTSAVAKTATNAMYIASSIATAIIMLNCVFTLAGTASSTNNCVGYNGVGSPTIAGINNSSLNVNVLLPQTTSVQSGITQIQYTNIQPPGLATYSSTVDQTIAVSGTPQALTYNTTQFNQGTTLLASSRVYANAQGNYALNYSVELSHAGLGVAQIATTFLKKNGTTIANTGRQWSITSSGFQNAAMAEFIVALNSGDYVEVFFSGDTSLSANATAAAGALPAIPSVVFNIRQFR